MQTNDDLKVKDILRQNKAIRAIQHGHWEKTQDHPRGIFIRPSIFIPFLPPGKLRVLPIVDAAEPSDSTGEDGRFWNGKWHAAYVIGVTSEGEATDSVNGRTFAPIVSKSGKTTRVARSSLDGEFLIMIEALDLAISLSLLIEEFQFGLRPSLWEKRILEVYTGIRYTPSHEEPTIRIELHTDSHDIDTHVNRLTFDSALNKRRKTDVADVQELIFLEICEPIVKILGLENPVDAISKKKDFQCHEMDRLREICCRGIYRPVYGNPKDRVPLTVSNRQCAIGCLRVNLPRY